MGAERSAGEVVKMIRRRARPVVASALVAMLVGAVVSLALPRTYLVETRLEVGSVGGLNGAEYANRVQAVNEQIRSHEAFAEVAKTLGLDAPSPSVPEARRGEKLEALLASLRDHTDVDVRNPANNAIYYVVVSHRNADAELAMRVVTALSEYYQKLAFDQPAALQQKNVEQLKTFVTQAKETFDAASAELLAYSNDNREFLDGAKEKLQATREQKRQLRDVDLANLEAQKKQLDEMLSQEQQFRVVRKKEPDSVRLAAVDTRIADARGKIEQLTVVDKKTEKHPEVMAARSLLADAEDDRKRLVDEAPEREVREQSEHWLQLKKTSFEVQSRLDAAGRQLQVLAATEREQAELAKRTPDIEAKKRSLADAETAAKKELDARTADMSKAERALADCTARGTLSIRPVDPPLKPLKPSGPGALMLALAGFIVGAGGGVGAAFVLDAMDRSFREVEAVTAFLGVPTLGAIHSIRTPAEDAQRRNAKRRASALLAALAIVAALVVIVAAYGDGAFVRDFVRSASG